MHDRKGAVAGAKKNFCLRTKATLTRLMRLGGKHSDLNGDNVVGDPTRTAWIYQVDPRGARCFTRGSRGHGGEPSGRSSCGSIGGRDA